MSWTEGGEPARAVLAALPEVRARWEARRTCTVPAERAEAETGVRRAYAAAGLPPPGRIVWCDSPMAIARCRREAGAAAGPGLKGQVVDGVVRAVARAVEAATPRGVYSRLWAETRFPAPSGVSRAVQEAIDAGLRAEGRDWPWSRSGGLLGWLGWRNRRRSPREQAFSELAFGQLDGPGLAIYESLARHGGLARETAPLQGLWQVAASAGWMVPHAEVCWLSERPDVLKVDAQQRLHAADGPALRFRDGWAHHAWKGVKVPSWLIEERQLVTAGLVNRENDPVLRRCMIDIMTPARYIETSDAVCISRDETGELWLKSWHHWDSWAAVIVVNGTPEPDGSYKRYVLQVPPTMRSAREAVAWTYGLGEHEYTRLRLRT